LDFDGLELHGLFSKGVYKPLVLACAWGQTSALGSIMVASTPSEVMLAGSSRESKRTVFNALYMAHYGAMYMIRGAKDSWGSGLQEQALASRFLFLLP
jgi:hypothetical protein